MIQNILFYVFSGVLILAALRVITASNPVHAALALVLCFFQGSLIWFLLKAEFLAITLVLVYVGAVMVLFLFVVMMIDINFTALREGFKRYLAVGSVIAALMVFQIAAIVFASFTKTDAALPAASATVGNTKVLGLQIYQNYVFPVQVAAVLLLVAMVAAIALTLRRRKDVKYNDPSAAVRVKAKDRLKVVKVDAVKPAPTQEGGAA